MKLKKILVLIMLGGVTFLNHSCGSKTENKALQDEQLSSFMLGGIYFINGYGGISQVNTILSDYNTPTELIEGYKELFEFPFDASQKSDTQSTLGNMWDITDKASLMESIKELQMRDHKFKAWDYARIMNNACMGFSAGYLTKDEVITIGKETLLLAREKYTDWTSYYTDFDLGRKDWNPEAENGSEFESLAKNIVNDEKSIYKVLPLHP